MDLLTDLARTIRSAVLPHIGNAALRGSDGVGVGGDPTFGIDELAEDAAEKFLDGHGDIAYYTEDRGLVERPRARGLLIVDPIDGTRPAGAGLEAACISIAAAPFDKDARIGDVSDGLIMEIKSGALYRARRGKGTRIIASGETRAPTPSQHKAIDGAFWTYGLRGRPAIPSAIVLEEMLDHSGVSGGAFELGSATFGITGVVSGRFDAYVDHGQRMIDDVPETRKLFEDIADGAVLNNNPYDVAAGLLIATEAGLIATDAAGRPLDDKPIVGSGADYCVSTVVACTAELHAEIIGALGRGIERLRVKMESRDG
jgi:myo-inositol-1(or 4)-monophosphatase